MANKEPGVWALPRYTLPEGAAPIYAREDEISAEDDLGLFSFTLNFDPPHDVESISAALKWALLAGVLASQRMDEQFIKGLEHAAGKSIPRSGLVEIRTALAHFYYRCVLSENSSFSWSRARKQESRLLKRIQKVCDQMESDYRGPRPTEIVASLRSFVEERRRATQELRRLDRLVIAIAKACKGIVGRSAYSPTGPLARVLGKVWEILPPEYRGKSADAFARRADKLRKYYGAAAKRRLPHNPLGLGSKMTSLPKKRTRKVG